MTLSAPNEITGELLIEGPLDDSGEGDTWGLLFDLQAVAHLEAQMGRTVIMFLRQFEDVGCGVADLQRFVLAGAEGYARRHRNGVKPLRPADAYDVITAGGGFGPMLRAVVESLSIALALKDSGEDGDASDDADPPAGGAAS